MAQGVFAITEQRDGELRKVSFEAVSEGRGIRYRRPCRRA
jgi:hypothetical protein